MNLSGQAVIPLLNYFKIPLDHLITVQDDIDLEFGRLRVQWDRGHAGHNGIRNISEMAGSAKYHRIKIGVGRPKHPDFAVADYVLQNFSKEELSELNKLNDLASDAIESLLREGAAIAATKFNQKI
jgi:PTH1 family peptidyl-tRNA hydrolase